MNDLGVHIDNRVDEAICDGPEGLMGAEVVEMDTAVSAAKSGHPTAAVAPFFCCLYFYGAGVPNGKVLYKVSLLRHVPHSIAKDWRAFCTLRGARENSAAERAPDEGRGGNFSGR